MEAPGSLRSLFAIDFVFFVSVVVFLRVVFSSSWTNLYVFCLRERRVFETSETLQNRISKSNSSLASDQMVRLIIGRVCLIIGSF